MSVPQQRAWIPPDREYDPEIVRWIGTPEHVEDSFVRDLTTNKIPNDYLDQFHEMLNRLTAVVLGRKTKASFLTWVIRFSILISHDQKAVVLKSIITRPCAERRGFARIVIFHVMRICYAVDYDLILDQPSTAVIRMLETVFDRRTVHEFDWGETNRPLRVELPQRRYLGNPWVVLSDTLRDSLWFEEPSVPLDWEPPAVPHLKPECFPSAHELNYGPRA